MQETENGHPKNAEQRGVFALLRSLGETGLDLVEGAAKMFASEGRIVLHRITVRLGIFVACVAAAASGFLLLLVGVAIGLSRVARSAGIDEWVALLVVGAVTLAVATVLAMRALRKVSDTDIGFPATLAELHSDIAAMRGRRPNGTDTAP